MLFSTKENVGVYKILIKSILIHYNKRFNANSDINYFKKKKFPLSFILFFIPQVLILLIFKEKEKFLFLKYKDCNIGRHVTARVYRDTSSYKSKFHLYKNYSKYFYFAGLIIESAYHYSKFSKAVYVDHCGYLNGLFFAVFSKKKKIVYTKSYPRGIFFIDFSKKKNYEKRNLEVCLKLKKKNLIKNSKKNYIKKYVLKPDLIPHVRKQKWHSLKVNLKKIDYVIYTHSFVDGLLWWGNDGFINLRDWTEFTIDTLIKKKSNILVKGHPNFYQKDKRETVALDKIIFNEIMKKYSYYENITFVNVPVQNNIVLNGIRKDTIIISHHGTAILEGVANKIKCISSVATFWGKEFKITNSWNSISSYKEMLNKKWKDLEYADETSFKILQQQFYGNQYALYGKKYWQRNLANLMGVSINTLSEKENIFEVSANKKAYNRSIKKLSSECIEEVNL